MQTAITLQRNSDAFSDSTISQDEFLRDMQSSPEPAKGTDSLSITPGADLLPDPQEIIYTDDDRPQDTPDEEIDLGDDGPKKSANVNIDTEDTDFGREFWAELGVDGLDVANQWLCGWIAKRIDRKKYAYSEHQKEQILRAAIAYMKTIQFSPSPRDTLIAAIGMATLPAVLMALGDRLAQETVEKNAPALVQAVAEATAKKEEKPRTDYRIFSNGKYMVDRYGEYTGIDHAKDEPNFNNPEEIAGIIKAKCGKKLRAAYPQFAEMIDRIENQNASK